MAQDPPPEEGAASPGQPDDGRAPPGQPDGSAPPEAGHRPGEHPTVRRSGIVGRPAAIAITPGLVLAALTYVAVVAGIVG